MGITLCYIIAYFIEALIIVQYCSSLFTAKHSKIIQWCVVLTLYTILFGISCLENFPLNMVSFLIINFIFILCIYETGWQSALFHTTIVTIVMGLSELIVSGVFTHLARNLYESDTYLRSLLILLVFAKQLYFWILFIISRFFVKSKDPCHAPGKEILLLTVIPLISIFVLITLISICYYVTLPEILNHMVSLSATLLLFANLTIWAIYIYSGEKNRDFTEMQLQLQKEYDSVSYYKMLLKQDEAQSILIHDIKKHLHSIALLNEQGEQEKVASYIKQLVNSSDLQSAYRVCDNEFLNAILCRYQNDCRERGISFHTDIRSNTVNFIEENDLTSLFCNLLDNAVESASKQTSSFIELNVLRKPQTDLTIITMVNSCRVNPFPTTGRKLVSTKKDATRHGFGIKSIKRIVAKYSGNMELYYDEEEKSFHTIITLINGREII